MRTYADFADESIFEKKEEKLEDCKITLIITKKHISDNICFFFFFLVNTKFISLSLNQ